jgi:uncharacterized Zn finger protein
MAPRYRDRYAYGWPDYVSVADRRATAKRKLAALRKQGKQCRPVVIEGRKIAHTFWGAAWCDNLETYGDFANRLPRGRNYLRNGSVIDLAIDTGEVTALVSGSEVYAVRVTVKPQSTPAWSAIVAECTGKIGSLVDLLQGKLSSSVMAVVTREKTGLFPAPREIAFRCSCPDGASMCKHVAAALYGVGARLDEEPALLFRLRHVDPEALIHHAAAPARGGGAGQSEADSDLADVDLSALFGIEIESHTAAAGSVDASESRSRRRPPKARCAPDETPVATSRPRATRTRKRVPHAAG